MTFRNSNRIMYLQLRSSKLKEADEVNVAGNIKFYISEKGIKQTTLSKKSGIAPPKLNLILSGKQRLTVSDYVAICKALTVPAATFLEKEA